jgi:hypothetical protein
MNARNPSWALVATVDEPAPLVAAMAAWHLSQGATEIWLYLDRPAADLRVLLAHLPQVRLIECDRGFWSASAFGRRPTVAAHRQGLNANHAYLRTGADWLLHSDADEFLLDGAVLARDLAGLSDSVDGLILPNHERAYRLGQPQRTLFDGVYRRQRHRFRWIGPAIHGSTARYLNLGVTGYGMGKALTRTGRDLEVSIHAPRARAGGADPVLALAETARILHFDAMTPLHFALKMLKRAAETRPGEPLRHAPSRRRTETEVARLADDPEALALLIRRITGLAAPQRLALRLAGMLTPVRFDPLPAIERHCPGLRLSPAAFDAALRAHQPDLAARLPEGFGT